MWKISYISSIPVAHDEYSATNVIPPVGTEAAVKRLPCHISQFAPTVHRGLPQGVNVKNFLYILHSSDARPAGARQYNTSSGAPGCAHKISTDIRLMLPPFLQGECPKFWPRLRPTLSSDHHIFEVRHFIGNQKQTCQGPMIGLSHTKHGVARCPQLREPLAQWVSQKGKSGKFLIYPPFQWPTPSTAPSMSYHLLGP